MGVRVPGGGGGEGGGERRVAVRDGHVFKTLATSSILSSPSNQQSTMMAYTALGQPGEEAGSSVPPTSKHEPVSNACVRHVHSCEAAFKEQWHQCL